MKHWKLENWCFEAVEKIKYRPDRDTVYKELLQHMEDRRDSFIAKGMYKEEAILKTVEAMGDSQELAVQLAAIHRPFWGFAYSIAKWLMRIAVVIALICILISIFVNGILIKSETDVNFTPSANPNTTHFFYTEPNSSDSSDGYTFTVTRAALHQDTLIPSAEYLFALDCSCLYIEVKVENASLWADQCECIHDFWGIDNQGQIYTEDPVIESVGSMTCALSYKDLFAQYYIFTVFIDKDEKCTWFDLRYNRDGRDVVLHIDLTGGDEA